MKEAEPLAEVEVQTQAPHFSWKQRLVGGDWGNWPIWIIPVICLLVWLAQLFDSIDTNRWAFSSLNLTSVRYETLLTSVFLHGGFAHIGMNMLALLSLSPLVVARFGRGVLSFFTFFLFYCLCGIAGNLAFWALHYDQAVPVVGASGAIYGVYAAAMRLNIFSDRLYPIISRQSLESLRFLVISNLVVILLFGGPEIIGSILSGHLLTLSIPIAWEAHVGGYICGFFLIGLMSRQWDGDWRAGIQIQHIHWSK